MILNILLLLTNITFFSYINYCFIVIRPKVDLEEVNEGSNEMNNLKKEFSNQNNVCKEWNDFKWMIIIIDFVMGEDSSFFKQN